MMIAALVVAAAFATPARVLPSLATTAETTRYARTGRYEEVLRLCRDYARAYPQVACETFGTSAEGRPMVALSVGARGRPTLVVQGGIHAGEIDGKDAGFLVLRQFLDGKLPGVRPDRLRLVFVPVFNVDGHERFGAWNRPNQVGPKEMGWRTTAQNLNLNRDYMKAEAPEMRAMLALMQREDPIVYVDLHVTDGANFQHDVAVLVDPPAGVRDAPPALADAAAKLRAAVLARLTAARHLPLVDFYPSFVDDDDPKGGFAAFAAGPRFSDAYAAARNRLGVLVETHSWKDYATRVRATRDTLAALLAELSAHGDEWSAAARAADALSLAGQPLVLAWHADRAAPRMIDFLGYAYSATPSTVSGKIHIHYDPTRPEVWHIPYFGTLAPSVTVTLPRAGWLVPRAFADVVAQKLAVHGIAYRDLPDTRTLPVWMFRADEVQRHGATFEGRAMVTLHGAWSAAMRAFAGGGLFVPVAQPRARLAAELLEPEGPDSLAAWGYFDTVFEQKEFMEDYVLEDVAQQMLKDPSVRAEFERKLADPAFANSPRQRLDFFYRRTPSWDTQLDVVPVYRLDRAP